MVVVMAQRYCADADLGFGLAVTPLIPAIVRLILVKVAPIIAIALHLTTIINLLILPLLSPLLMLPRVDEVVARRVQLQVLPPFATALSAVET